MKVIVLLPAGRVYLPFGRDHFESRAIIHIKNKWPEYSSIDVFPELDLAGSSDINTIGAIGALCRSDFSLGFEFFEKQGIECLAMEYPPRKIQPPIKTSTFHNNKTEEQALQDAIDAIIGCESNKFNVLIAQCYSAEFVDRVAVTATRIGMHVHAQAANRRLKEISQ
jgi:hypothetical protein